MSLDTSFKKVNNKKIKIVKITKIAKIVFNFYILINYSIVVFSKNAPQYFVET